MMTAYTVNAVSNIIISLKNRFLFAAILLLIYLFDGYNEERYQQENSALESNWLLGQIIE
jgi:hypothetical protein